jgi:hypothetical protein
MLDCTAQSTKYRRTSMGGTTFSGKKCLSGTIFHATWLDFPYYLTTFSGEKCLSGKVICAFFCPAYRSPPVVCAHLHQASHRGVSLCMHCYCWWWFYSLCWSQGWLIRPKTYMDLGDQFNRNYIDLQAHTMTPCTGMLSPITPTRPGGDEKGRGAARKGILANIFPLRQRFAKGIRQIAEVTADHVSKYPPPPL